MRCFIYVWTSSLSADSKRGKKLVVTGRRCIESYMIYQSDDDIECIAFSTQHLTVANDIRPVLEISKYVIRNTDTPDVKLTSYFLSPHEYSFLRDPLTFEGQVGTSFKFIVSNKAPWLAEGCWVQETGTGGNDDGMLQNAHRPSLCLNCW